MERAVGKNEMLESLKLESFAEVGKSQAKLERTDWSWKEPIEVWKFEVKLESTTDVGKWLMKLESLNWTWKDSMKLESYY